MPHICNPIHRHIHIHIHTHIHTYTYTDTRTYILHKTWRKDDKKTRGEWRKRYMLIIIEGWYISLARHIGKLPTLRLRTEPKDLIKPRCLSYTRTLHISTKYIPKTTGERERERRAEVSMHLSLSSSKVCMYWSQPKKKEEINMRNSL